MEEEQGEEGEQEEVGEVTMTTRMVMEAPMREHRVRQVGGR